MRIEVLVLAQLLIIIWPTRTRSQLDNYVYKSLLL